MAYVVDDGNSTRPATPSEIAEHLGIKSCKDISCSEEKEHLRQEVVEHRRQMDYINDHAEEVHSMVLAGIDALMNFEKSDTIPTDSSFTPTTTQSLRGQTAIAPSRPSLSAGSIPGNTADAAIPRATSMEWNGSSVYENRDKFRRHV